MLSKPIEIQDFNKGIGKSPHLGFGFMVNIDNQSDEGLAKINYKTTRVTHNKVASQTFTASPATNQLTITNEIENLSPVTVSSTDTLPNGLSAATTYFAIYVSATVIKLASSYANAKAGTAVTISDGGTGVHSIVTTDFGVVYWMTSTPGGIAYALDSNGRLWRADASETNNWELVTAVSSGGGGTGLVYWKGSIFIGRATTVDAYRLSDATVTTSIVGSLTSGSMPSLPHTMFVSSDDIVYIANGRYIASLEEVGTFNQTDSGTYSASTNALDLAEDLAVMCFEDLGSKLLIGTIFSTGAESTQASIYPWDKTSPVFDDPIQVGENGVYAMYTKDNLTYVLAGKEGSIYVTNGAVAKLVRELPFEKDSLNLRPYPDTLDSFKNELLFGISRTSAGTNSPCGVWSLKDGTLRVANTISNGSDGSTSGVFRIPSVLTVSNTSYFIGWNDEAASNPNGIDKVGISSYKYPSYAAYIETPMLIVGTSDNKTAIEIIEIYLERPLAAGEGIKVRYRTGLNTAWSSATTVGTIEYDANVSVQNYKFDFTADSLTTVQFQVLLTTGSSSATTPRLRLLRIQ